MQSINLLKHACTTSLLNEQEIEMFVKVDCAHTPDNVRVEEYHDLRSFISFLDVDDFKFYDYFYFDYSIPHIGKEFDLLRIAKNYNINIELKSKKSREAILSQLRQNDMYLSFLKKKVYCFTYEVSTNTLFFYADDDLKIVDKVMLVDLIKGQKTCFKGNLDNLFSPDNYLVSPFNDPERFMSHQYFLNQEQYTRKCEIKEAFSQIESQIILLNGSSGSGKTLLIYDLVSELNHAAIYHVAALNEGQKKLINEYQWKIYSNIDSINYINLDYLIIDEAQRLNKEDASRLINSAKLNNVHLLFAYDKKQVFNGSSAKESLFNYLESSKSLQVNLKGKVRGSKEINCFIEKCFDLKSHVTYHYSNIEVTFFESNKQAEQYISYLTTYHQYHSISRENIEEAVGKEYNKVVVTMDPDYYYDDHGKLNHHNNQLAFMYEAMTRAKTHLSIVVINSIELFRVLLHILDE